jgi:hypothetical protein
VLETLPVIGKPFKALQDISRPIQEGVSTALKLVKKVPVPAATAAGGAIAGAGAAAALSGGGGEGVPALPGGGGALVPYAGGATSSMAGFSMKGSGALLNPQIAQVLSSMSIPPEQIPAKYAPPRGYVIVRAGGAVLCIPKSIAIHFGLWHHARRPPISAGDWHKYQTARRVEKKLRILASHAIRKHNAGRHTAEITRRGK